MVDLRRKLIALLLALLFVAGTVALSGCKGDDTGKKKPPTPKKMQELE